MPQRKVTWGRVVRMGTGRDHRAPHRKGLLMKDGRVWITGGGGEIYT